MTGNEIGDEGAKVMSEMLTVKKSLISLYLSCEEEKRMEKRKKREKG